MTAISLMHLLFIYFSHMCSCLLRTNTARTSKFAKKLQILSEVFCPQAGNFPTLLTKQNAFKIISIAVFKHIRIPGVLHREFSEYYTAWNVGMLTIILKFSLNPVINPVMI